MKKILLLTKGINSEKNGGVMVSKDNINAIKSLDVDLDIISLERDDIASKDILVLNDFKNKRSKVLNILFKIRFLSLSTEKIILSLIKEKKYDFIFIEYSFYGGLIKKIKNYNSSIKIIVYFHNIEINYLKGRINKESKKNYLLYFATYINEFRSCKFSDYLLVLNKREEKELLKIYGKKLSYKIRMIPLTLKNNYNKIPSYDIENDKLNLLFVGSYFYPNIEGITWFYKKVFKNLNCKLTIIGKGMENLREKINDSNVEILGYVEELDEYYEKADYVIAPIFSGAGMKTKTVEALMYGKKIIGTTEAFEGFEKNKEVLISCNTQEEYITFLKDKKSNKNKYSSVAKETFINNYDRSVKINKLKIIFGL